MTRRDSKERLGKVPGSHQRTSGLAVIDSAQLLFNLEKIAGMVCPALDDESIRLWHERDQSHPADVMQNSGRIGEILVQDSPFCAALGDDRAGDAVMPARLD